MSETFEKMAEYCKPTMEHPVAIVLGSGLGSLGERVRVVRHIEKMAEYCKPTMEHPVAIVLGSGLGSLGERVRVVRHIPYSDIDGFPAVAIPVEGHRFTVLVGELDGVPVVVYPGRVHMYQGYDALQVTSLVRHAHKLGCRSIVLSCATGAVGDACTCIRGMTPCRSPLSCATRTSSGAGASC